MRLQGFDPIIAEHPHAMILGSMPSVVSLERQEYYGFKQNRFWRIMEAYFQQELSNYEAKIDLIKNNHLILWDVIGSCEREGSLDSAIRNVQVNDIQSLLDTYQDLRFIICNGKKSYELFTRYFGKSLHIDVFCLPSTSNANRTIKETELYQVWFSTMHQVFDAKSI